METSGPKKQWNLNAISKQLLALFVLWIVRICEGE
jgi:hypothetical protein